MTKVWNSDESIKSFVLSKEFYTCFNRSPFDYHELPIIPIYFNKCTINYEECI